MAKMHILIESILEESKKKKKLYENRKRNCPREARTLDLPMIDIAKCHMQV
jgi:hypothetical protein